MSTRTYAEASVHATIYWVSGGSTHSVYTFTRRSRVQIQQSSVFGGAAASFVRPPPPFFWHHVFDMLLLFVVDNNVMLLQYVV